MEIKISDMNNMKNSIFILALSLGLICSCVPAEPYFDTSKNMYPIVEEPETPTPPEGGDETPGPGVGDDEIPDSLCNGVDPRLFKVMNMDYPGLENMKAKFSNKEYYAAAEALLAYYRSRTVVNPDANLLDTKTYPDVQNVADQALEHRLYTMGYYEGRNSAGQLVYYDMSDTDGSINWEKIPSSVKDRKEYNKQILRMMWLPFLARTWNASKDAKYVNQILADYRDFIKQYPCPEGTGTSIAWTGLQTSTRILNLLLVWEYIIKAEVVTPQDMAMMLIFLNDSVESLRRTWYLPENANIYLEQVQALVESAIYFPEFNLGKEWFEEGAAKTSRQLDLQFNPDGVQNECDMGYHQGVLGNFISIYDFIKANDKISEFPSTYKQRLKSACHFMMDLVYPEYKLENFNDSRSSRQTKNTMLKSFKTYVELFPDDEKLQWMASDGKSGAKPSEKVQMYTYTGWYAMRTEWGQEGTMLIHKNNNNVNAAWHCQSDNGTIALWKDGRRFLPDAGCYTYTEGAVRDSWAATWRHNTLTKDKGNILKALSHGEYLADGSSPTYKYIVTQNQSYSDLAHRRAIFMVNNEFFVIVDEAIGKASSPVNIHFHLCADIGGLGLNVVEIDDASSSCCYGAHTVFADGNNMMFRTFSESHTNFKGENGVSQYSDELGYVTADRRYYRVTVDKPASSSVRFATVICPITQSSDIQTRNVSVEFLEGNKLQVMDSGKEYILSYTL